MPFSPRSPRDWTFPRALRPPRWRGGARNDTLCARFTEGKGPETLHSQNECPKKALDQLPGPLDFVPCALDRLHTFDAYLESLSAPIDSFLEDLILDATPYATLAGDREVGSFCVAEAGTLMQFYLLPEARPWSRSIFAEVRGRFDVSSAVVPTCDEYFLGLALDDYVKIEKGAYFFVDGPLRETRQLDERLAYRPAKPRDLDSIRSANEDFLDDPGEELEKGQLHIGFREEEIVALGLIVQSRLLRQHASIGIFTCKAYRRQGIATRTIDYLRRACRTQGLTPIAGCWYYNEASRLTLEAAGMIVSSRLLRFTFTEDE